MVCIQTKFRQINAPIVASTPAIELPVYSQILSATNRNIYERFISLMSLLSLRANALLNITASYYTLL